MATKGQELKDLDVDRVDGVDRPATGRKFLLFKDEDGGASIMKGYAMVATAAAEVLKAIRKDSKAVVSRKSAIALNGLAQVLGADAVFTSKAVPTQPYEFSEPNADKRGPEDENLSGNFTPRSMPGSMVGKVSFRMKDEAEEEEDRKAKRGPKMYDEEDRKVKGVPALEGDKEDAEDYKAPKSATKAADDGDDDDDMDASERANRGVARGMAAMAKAIEAQTEILKGLSGQGEPLKKEVRKDEGDKPRSKQAADGETVTVRKSGYEPRFGADMTSIVFGGGRN